MIKRHHFDILKQRIEEPRHFLQVITGPRQVGKTTLVKQLLKEIMIPYHFASADETVSNDVVWIEQQWEVARLTKQKEQSESYLLVIDEIQKIKDWSRVVKKEWDKDSWNDLDIRVIILGSSRLLLEEGLSESLAGRFERIYMTHWSFSEMQAAFDVTLEEYIWFGGYPGTMIFQKNESRWKDYVRNALVETTISKDILHLTPIRKPALLRRLFEFSCIYSSKILSYTKMLGQLMDAGNTTTLAHYLRLLDSAGLVRGLENYSGSFERTKASSPKLQVLNTAFLSVFQTANFAEVRSNPTEWGKHVESIIGAHLINGTIGTNMKLFYWRKGNNEVDFVLQKGDKLIGIEVKSSASRYHKGTAIFKGTYHPHKVLLVGEGGIALEDFLLIHPENLF